MKKRAEKRQWLGVEQLPSQQRATSIQSMVIVLIVAIVAGWSLWGERAVQRMRSDFITATSSRAASVKQQATDRKANSKVGSKLRSKASAQSAVVKNSDAAHKYGPGKHGSSKTKQTIAEKFGVTADDWRLVLVNREHPREEMNPQLTELNNRCSIDSRVADELSEFLHAAQKVDSSAHFISCYRSVAYQTQLFEGYVNDELAAHPDWNREQAETQVKTYSQPAGQSEHQTGLAVDLSTAEDINVQDPALAQRIQSLAPQYGFILRFLRGKEQSTGVDYEDWHFRYVGQGIAQYITAKGWTLEEFLDHLNDPV